MKHAVLAVTLLVGLAPLFAQSAERGIAQAYCDGKPFEAQFIAEVTKTEQTKVFDREKGQQCRFKIAIHEWNEHSLCPFPKRSAVEGKILKLWDHKRGCPDKGDQFSGVVQKLPNGSIEFDADWNSVDPKSH